MVSTLSPLHTTSPTISASSRSEIWMDTVSILGIALDERALAVSCKGRDSRNKTPECDERALRLERSPGDSRIPPPRHGWVGLLPASLLEAAAQSGSKA